MVFVALSLKGTRETAIPIEPDIIYRIGRRSGLEFHCDDESIELAHATITLIAGGIVRLSAVAGKVYVKNGQEIETKSINDSDTVNDFVDLRFGNVNAKLYFNDGKQLDIDAAHDSSGYEEGIKNRSVNTSTDSLVIPESRPQSTNTTREDDSFIIPETQAVSFTRPSRSLEVSKVSCGEDFLIPETQDVFAFNNKPSVQPVSLQDPDILDEDDASELGTQIRICTQEFNEMEEDAIDDFDSSLLLGEGNLAVFGKSDPKQTADITGVDNDMSALNWSSSNSKCTAVNSTKADEVSTRNEACLTPDLSSAGIASTVQDEVPCTPDLFDFLKNDDLQSSGSQAPEIINVNADVHSVSSNQIAADTNKLCTAEHPLVASIYTPETTPADPEDNLQGYIETQAFPLRKPIERAANTHDSTATQAFERVSLQLALNSSTEEDNEDFIKTQAFPGKKSFPSAQQKTSVSSNSSKVEDNMEFNKTLAFPGIKSFPSALQKSNLASNSSKDEDNENCIKIQIFPGKKSFPSVQQKSNLAPNSSKVEDNEDCIKIQIFPGRKSFSVPQQKSNLSSNSSKDEDNEDFIKTQLFPGRKSLSLSQLKSKTADNSNNDNHNEDLIATQAFPGRISFLTPQAKSKRLFNSNNDEDNEDLIETQVFPGRKSFLVPQSTPKNPGRINLGTTEDFKDTELFVGHKNTDPNNGERLQISDSISICDDIDRELKEFMALSEMTSSSSDDETYNNIIKPSSTQGKKLENKLCQSKEIVKELGRPETSAKLGRKRFALRSESVESPPCKMKRTRKTSEPPTPTKTLAISKSGLRKRSKALSEESITPPKKIRSEKSKNKEGTNDVGKKSQTETLPLIEDKVTMPQMKTLNETKVASTLATNQKLVVKVKKERSARNSKDEEKPQPVIKRRTRKATQETVDDNMQGTSKDAGKAADSADSQPLNKRQTRKSKVNKDNIKEEESATVKKLDKGNTVARIVVIHTDSSNSEDEASCSKSVTNTGKSKGTKVASAKIVDSKKTSKAKAKQGNKEQEKPSAKPLDEEKTTSIKRTNNISNYIKKIQSSGRKIQITLSMCNYSELNPLLYSLRNVVEATENPLSCDLLLMDKGERTYKFLVGVASNKPILSTRWLHSIKASRSIVVKPNHIFKDEKFEELFKFNPLSVMEHPSLLKDLNFMLGNTIQPNIKDMKAIIESAGGTVHNKPPPIASNVHFYVVASPQDKSIFKLLRNYTNLQYIKTEGVMQALVQHKTELLNNYKLNI